MSPSKMFGRPWRRIGSAPARLAFLLALAALAACSSSVDVSFQLVPACSDRGLLNGNNCNFIRVIVSELNPAGELCPTCDPGPLAKTCALAENKCKINGDDLLGSGRIVDVLCYPSMDVAPVARGTSQALLIDDTHDGAGGKRIALQMGMIDSFVQTTYLDSHNLEYANCSLMAETSGRYAHAAAVLDDGRVLITGGIKRFGQGVEEILATAEIFDPATGEHRLLLGPDGLAVKMHASSGRAYHTMTRLRDGRVLIAGGVGPIQQGATTVRTALRSAEIFDPDTETFVSPMDMGVGRAHHAATMLATGTVLITGGATYGNNGAIDNWLDSGAIFDPSNNSWTPVSNTMSTGRAFHRAILLDPTATGGKVLVVGGENASGTLGSADIFDPNSLTFYSGVDVTMTRNRSRFCAVRLKSGRVLVAGGTTVADDPGTADVFENSPDSGVEVYDPSNGSFGAFLPAGPNLLSARMNHTCHLLEDGNVLVAGGLSGGHQATSLGELIRDTGGTYSVDQLPDPLQPARYLHTGVTLRNGWVLLSGGLPGPAAENQALSESTLFVPPPAFQ